MRKYPNVHFVDPDNNLEAQIQLIKKYDEYNPAELAQLDNELHGLDLYEHQLTQPVGIMSLYDEDGAVTELQYTSIGRPFINNETDTTFTYYNPESLKNSEEVYRLCTPDDKCFPRWRGPHNEIFEDGAPVIKLESRLAEGPRYRYYDNLDERKITLKCTGTNKSG